MTAENLDFDVVKYLDELVEATIKTRVVGHCLIELGASQGVFCDASIIDIGTVICAQAERLDAVVASLGDEITIRVV